MTRNKTLDTFLIVFFSMAGIAVLILTWTQPMPVFERILSTSAGSIGLLGALIRTLVLKSARARPGVAPVPVEASIEEH